MGVQVKNKIRIFFHETFSICLGIIALPFFLSYVVTSIPIFIWRFLISKTSKYLRPDLDKMVTAAGHYFAVEGFKHNSRCVIALTVIFQGSMSLEEVQEVWFKRAVNARHQDGFNHFKYPELQQYLTTWMGFKFWKPDPQFHIKNHVTHYKPDDSISTSFNEADLPRLHEYLHNTPFPPKRSPWDVLVARNYQSETLQEVTRSGKVKPMTLVAFRFHHCLADGYSIQQVLVEGVLGTPVSSIPRPKPSLIEPQSKSHQLLRALATPYRMFYDAAHFLEMGFGNIPWIVRDKEKAWMQVVSLTPMIPVNSIKDIKNSRDVSFTSVLISAITGAVRKLLLNKEFSFDECRMPTVFALPLSNHPHKLRNHFTLAYMDIPLEEDDPIKRLERCNKILLNAKRSSLPILCRYMMILFGSSIYCMVRLFTKNRMIPLGITNFPGLDVQIGLPGRVCLEVCGSAGPAAGCAGALFAIVSYGSGIRFSVTAEKSLLSQADADALTTYICEEINVLQKETT